MKSYLRPVDPASHGGRESLIPTGSGLKLKTVEVIFRFNLLLLVCKVKILLKTHSNEFCAFGVF